MDNNQNNFSYKYSAKEQAELKKIREKYAPTAEDKMTQLRKLDAGVTKKGRAWAITVGIIGSLILGFGMSLALTDLGAILGSLGDLSYIIGIASGLVGISIVAIAYPIYTAITKKEREKVAPEILRLTDELMK